VGAAAAAALLFAPHASPPALLAWAAACLYRSDE
jgi:uncharacterized protein (DUF2236 family)